MATARKKPNRTKEPYAFWISPDQKEALRAIKDRDGIPVSEQIRRAIDQWLAEKAGSRRDLQEHPEAGSRGGCSRDVQ